MNICKSRLAIGFVAGSLLCVGACRSNSPTETVGPFLFDDFNHATFKDLSRGGWVVRSAIGWPGIEGAI